MKGVSMTVKAEELADSLHIDQSEQEIATLKDLIDTSKDIIKSSVNYKLSDDAFAGYPMFDSAVKSLAQAMYYDRSLENGTPKAVVLMITHLQARLGE